MPQLAHTLCTINPIPHRAFADADWPVSGSIIPQDALDGYMRDARTALEFILASVRQL